MPLSSSVEVHKLPDGCLYRLEGKYISLRVPVDVSLLKTETKAEPVVSAAVNEKAGTTPTRRPA